MLTDSTESEQLAVLVEELAVQDAAYLRLADDKRLSPRSPRRISEERLIRELAEHSEPRVRESLIPLFLRRRALHRYVPKAVDELDIESAQTLRHFYTAAVYLQYSWRSSLSIYLGEFKILPNYFGESLFQLSSPQHHSGEAGLRQLADRFQRETGVDWLTTYDAALTRFLSQQSLAGAKQSHD